MSRLILKLFPGLREYSSVEALRSDSDNGGYLNAVQRAASSYRHFREFKRNRDYNKILEHVSREEGEGYLNILRDRDDGIFENARETVLQSDSLGNPRRYDYGTGAPLSPTTLRYLKVASDLQLLFGDLQGMKLAEIGGGYGGQCLVLDTVFSTGEYHIYDLPDVSRLVARYLESFLMNGAYVCRTINTTMPEDYDLVISNYAVSELPRALQETYIRKVASRSRRGYLTMNSGLSDHAGREGTKLSLDEWKQRLPPFEIFEERPKTADHNYIIAWGHKPGVELYHDPD